MENTDLSAEQARGTALAVVPRPRTAPNALARIANALAAVAPYIREPSVVEYVSSATLRDGNAPTHVTLQVRGGRAVGRLVAVTWLELTTHRYYDDDTFTDQPTHVWSGNVADVQVEVWARATAADLEDGQVLDVNL